MFRQDVPEIARFSLGKDKFEDSGCAICSVLHHVEQIKGRYYSPIDVEKHCLDMFDNGIINDELYVKSWNEIFLFFGVPVATRFEPEDYICKEKEIEILKLQKKGYTHFVPGDGEGNYSWDSLGRRPAQKGYHIADKRIMRIL